ncbi:unnamed protein product [Phytophthora fragariaefolia]|uniref:Unnamed protein product n=1 Tax=Phytophthora fragariaefolia TaxID=1490495 RepID=A0A9W6WTB1_9STRA|nr:unnamed protein product [Phytophthora fragariaefolia]
MGKTYLKYAEERTKLSRLRLESKDNLPDHLSEMRRIMETISVVGRPVDEYAKPAILIGSLPRDYDNVVQTFLASHTTQNPDGHQTMNSWSKHWRWPTTTLKTARRKAARVMKKTKPSLLLGVVVVDEELIAVVDAAAAVVDVVLALRRIKSRRRSRCWSRSSKGNESDDTAYVSMNLMNLEKNVANIARDRWYLDSGATNHMTNQKDDFISFTSLSSTVRTGGNNWLEVAGIGTVKKEIITSSGRVLLFLHGVRYVPELQCSLFSVGRQASRSIVATERVRCHFDEDDYAYVLLQAGRTKAHKDETNLYRLKLESPSDAVLMVSYERDDKVELWHDRLGHPGRNAFNALSTHSMANKKIGTSCFRWIPL